MHSWIALEPESLSAWIARVQPVMQGLAEGYLFRVSNTMICWSRPRIVVCWMACFCRWGQFDWFSCGLGLAAIPMIFGRETLAVERPNILFIAVDDMRCDLGCYGVSHVHSPHLDRLARSGVLFQRAYCQQAVCNASRVSLMTGLRPDSTRVWDLVTDFRTTIPEAVTIPQHFRQHGYRAEAFGKIFHNTFPDDVSWDEPTHRPTEVIAYSPENQQRLLEYRQQMKAKGMSATAIERMRGPATEIQEQLDDKNYDGKQTLEAIALMRQLVDQPAPFFLAVGYIRPHLPFITPKKYWDLYDRAAIPLASNGFFPKDAPAVAFGDRSLGGFYELRGYMDYADAPSPWERPLTSEQQRELKHGYYASVSFVDAQIGRLLEAVDQLQVTDKTVIVLWSDHGWKLGEHGGWCKQTNYEIDTRVPLIIRAPGASSNGRSCRALVEFVDLYPTLCALAELPIPEQLEGKSLVPLLADTEGKVKDAAFSQFERRHQDRQYMGYAMRTEDYRYIEWLEAETGAVAARELYDHRRDPQENQNLAVHSQHGPLMEALNRQMWSTLSRPKFPLPLARSAAANSSAEARTSLRWIPSAERPLPPSRPAGQHRAVTFINGRVEPVELWWISPDGDKQSYGVLGKDDRKTIRTRRGAVWLVEDQQSQSLGYFVTADENATATIPP